MNALYRMLHTRLGGGLSLLADKPEETVDSTLRALWHTAAGNPQSAMRAMELALPPIDEDSMQAHALESLIARRLAGIPLSHLTGCAHFMGLELAAGPQALVPRAETALLAQAAIGLLRQSTTAPAQMNVVDVCTGSGNVALALAHHVPDLRVHGSDLSVEAIDLARRNALDLDLADRVQFHVGDFMAPFETSEFIGKLDLLTCNPPYIGSKKVERMPAEIAEHEPRAAFDGGMFGVALLMRLLEEAPRFLREDGWLAFEVGLDQGPALLKRMQRNRHFSEIRAVNNTAGAVRTIIARRS